MLDGMGDHLRVVVVKVHFANLFPKLWNGAVSHEECDRFGDFLKSRFEVRMAAFDCMTSCRMIFRISVLLLIYWSSHILTRSTGVVLFSEHGRMQCCWYLGGEHKVSAQHRGFDALALSAAGTLA